MSDKIENFVVPEKIDLTDFLYIYSKIGLFFYFVAIHKNYGRKTKKI